MELNELKELLRYENNSTFGENRIQIEENVLSFYLWG